jgi:hypothetical protein
MNTGMPTASKMLTKAILASGGYVGILGWILQQILERVFNNGSKKMLVYMDKGQVLIVVNNELNDFNKNNDIAWSIVDKGKVLTKEEIDAIDKPVLDSFIKLATFNKLRRPS